VNIAAAMKVSGAAGSETVWMRSVSPPLGMTVAGPR
jgi:hypothetical protein